METLLLIMSSIALVLSFLSLAWILRCNELVPRVFKISAVLILMFAGWEFVENISIIESIADGLIVKSFVIFTALMNSYHAWHAVTHQTEIVDERRAIDSNRRKANRRVVL